MKKEKENLTVKYYNFFAPIFDILSNKYVYQKSRTYAIQQLDLKPNQIILNLPCGTGQNFELFQEVLNGTGRIYGIDLSVGMLKQAERKVQKNQWKNIELIHEDAANINQDWVYKNIAQNFKFDAIFCDFGLSNFAEWELVLEQIISILKPNGKLAVLDWYIGKPSKFWFLVKYLKIGNVELPIQEKMKAQLQDVKTKQTFAGGRIFVASGRKIDN